MGSSKGVVDSAPVLGVGFLSLRLCRIDETEQTASLLETEPHGESTDDEGVHIGGVIKLGDLSLLLRLCESQKLCLGRLHTIETLQLDLDLIDTIPCILTILDKGIQIVGIGRTHKAGFLDPCELPITDWRCVG